MILKRKVDFRSIFGFIWIDKFDIKYKLIKIDVSQMLLRKILKSDFSNLINKKYLLKAYLNINIFKIKIVL